jgi:retron-type reverse transcriptase
MIILENKIADRRFTKLIRKALKAGYFENARYQSNVAVTPQGSIVSPILANIFLHRLDEYILKLKQIFDKGVRAPRSKESRYFEYHINKARKEGNFVLERQLIAQITEVPATDFGSVSYKRLCYVRYADD